MNQFTVNEETADVLCNAIRSVLTSYLSCGLTSKDIGDITRDYREIITGVKFEPPVAAINPDDEKAVIDNKIYGFGAMQLHADAAALQKQAYEKNRHLIKPLIPGEGSLANTGGGNYAE